MELLSKGAEQAVQDGDIALDKYLQLKKNIDAYKIATADPYEAPDVRGTWIWGPPGVGKSRHARTEF